MTLTLAEEMEILKYYNSGLGCRTVAKQVYKDKGIQISHQTVANVFKARGKIHEARQNDQPLPKRNRQRKVRTQDFINRVKTFMVANPQPVRVIAQKLGTSHTTVTTTIHADLGYETRRKTRVHKLSQRDMVTRKKNCRKLYTNHLAGSKGEYVVTIDEALFSIADAHQPRRICYVRKGEETPSNWVNATKQTFPESFMVVAVLCGRGRVMLVRVPKKVKITSAYYIQHVLQPLIDHHLPLIYPNELHKVYIHHDAATSHVSKETTSYLNIARLRTGIDFIAKEDIPIRSPDASPCDFFAFGFLKQRLAKRRARTIDGVWKCLQEEWEAITPQVIQSVFGAWKLRARMIGQGDGSHIEQTKDIHRRRVTI